MEEEAGKAVAGLRSWLTMPLVNFLVTPPSNASRTGATRACSRNPAYPRPGIDHLENPRSLRLNDRQFLKQWGPS